MRNKALRPSPVSLLILCLPWLHAMPTLAMAQGTTPTTVQEEPQEEAEQDPPQPGNGNATRAWLQKQAAGTLASKQRQTLSGPVMSKVHGEYVKSFDRSAATAATDATAKK